MDGSTEHLTDPPFLYLGGLGYWQEPDLGLLIDQLGCLRCLCGTVDARLSPMCHGAFMSTTVSPPLLPPPTPNEEEMAAFASWYQGHFGVDLDPNEAKERLTTLAHFFFYTRGYATYPHHFTNDKQCREEPIGDAPVRALRS